MLCDFWDEVGRERALACLTDGYAMPGGYWLEGDPRGCVLMDGIAWGRIRMLSSWYSFRGVSKSWRCHQRIKHHRLIASHVR
jgi:hypothetical protein